MKLEINGRSYNIKSCVWCPFFQYELDSQGYAAYICKLYTFLNGQTLREKIMANLIRRFIWSNCPLKKDNG